MPPVAGTISGNTSVCQGETNLDYSIPTIENADTYIWTLPTGVSGYSTTNNITVNYGANAVSGDIKVKGHNACGDGAEASLYVNIIDAAFPKIKAKWNDVLICLNIGDSLDTYQWYKNNIIIPGATEQFYVTHKHTGSYHVVVTDISGCSNSSNIIDIFSNKSASISPNPANNFFKLNISDQSTGKIYISIINNLGIKVKQIEKKKISDSQNYNINVSDLPTGIYYVKVIINNEQNYISKLFINR